MTDLLGDHAEAFRAEHRLPSLIVAVVGNGAVIEACGTAAPGHPIPDPTSIMRIASMTKSFTAAAVLLLRDRGALALDDPIATHVRELSALPRSSSDSPPITIRHLLTMSAGLATDDAWGDRHLDASPTDMDAWFANVAELAHPTGTNFEYSNLGYGMLGRLLDRLTGDGLAFISDELLRPLDLVDTLWMIDETRASRAFAPHRVVDGDIQPEGQPPLGPGAMSTMGGLWSTVTDLARWVGFWCDAFPARDDHETAPLCRASRREAQQVSRAYDPPELNHRPDGTVRQIEQGYAMGLERFHHVELGPVVCHGGGLPGYGSHMRWLPERGIGVVAMANRTYAPVRLLTDRVLDGLAESGRVPAAREFTPRHLRLAAERLVALWNDWDTERCADLFADNMALDEPLERQQAAAHDLVGELGTLAVGRISPLSVFNGTLIVNGPSGEAAFDLELSPIAPQHIQRVARQSNSSGN